MSRPLQVYTDGIVPPAAKAGLDSVIDAGAEPTRMGVVTVRAGLGCDDDALDVEDGFDEEPPHPASKSSAPAIAATRPFMPARPAFASRRARPKVWCSPRPPL